MRNRNPFLLLSLLGITALGYAPVTGQTIDEVCSDRGARTDDATVRVAWTDLDTGYDDVRVSYCVMRGHLDAKLSFERNAEIVYLALASIDRRVDRRPYTFVIRTSTGRVLRQGPALLQPVAKQLVSCRVDVCQFFTDPGERVISVSVE